MRKGSRIAAGMCPERTEYEEATSFPMSIRFLSRVPSSSI